MNIRHLKKFTNLYIWKRLLYERLSEPLHLNFIALFVSIFGSYRTKIDFDLIIRQQHAYSLLNVADMAKELGYQRVTICEFGVSAGAGLLNLQEIAKEITKTTEVEFDIYGFDSGQGMPPPESYKDHPEYYQTGDFPMDYERLVEKLYANTHLIIGPISKTMNEFLSKDFSNSPIGFISIDVDYYFSTVEALQILKSNVTNILPRVLIYLDDVEFLNHNSWCGEQAAVNEFTVEFPSRPIERHTFLRGHRVFKNARWIDHIYQCHILDHPIRNDLNTNRPEATLTNPYL